MSKLDSALDKSAFAWEDLAFCTDARLNKRRDILMDALVGAQRSVEADAPKNPDARLASNPVLVAQKALNALEAEMLDSMIDLRFTAVNYGVWQMWIRTHPPRKANQTDIALGFNTETFFLDAMKLSAKFVEEPGTKENNFEDAKLVEITEKQWDRIITGWTAGDWDRVHNVLITLNQRDGQRGVAFLKRGSKATQSSEPTSD